MARRGLLTLFVTLIALIWASDPAHAGIYLNTFQPVAALSPDGETLEVTVKLGCDRGERFTLRVTVNQRDSGAVAEGRTRGVCRGDGDRGTFRLVPVTVHVIGEARFDRSEGATPAGLGITTVRRRGARPRPAPRTTLGRSDAVERADVHQWIPDFELTLQ